MERHGRRSFFFYPVCEKGAGPPHGAEGQLIHYSAQFLYRAWKRFRKYAAGGFTVLGRPGIYTA